MFFTKISIVASQLSAITVITVLMQFLPLNQSHSNAVKKIPKGQTHKETSLPTQNACFQVSSLVLLCHSLRNLKKELLTGWFCRLFDHYLGKGHIHQMLAKNAYIDSLVNGLNFLSIMPPIKTLMKAPTASALHQYGVGIDVCFSECLSSCTLRLETQYCTLKVAVLRYLGTVAMAQSATHRVWVELRTKLS